MIPLNKKKILRIHQVDANNASREVVKRGGIPYLDCCVSFGKSLCMADITNSALAKGGRVLQITPSLELCRQNYIETHDYIDNPEDVGIVCSGLNRQDLLHRAIVCTYGSFLKHRASSGKFDVVLIDECFSGDVEILTENGFQRFDSLDKKISVAQYDEGTISFVTPSRYIEKPYVGDMINIKNDKLIDIDVTPNHDLLINHYGSDRKVKAKDALFNCNKKVYVAGKTDGKQHGLSSKEKLMIATQADGSIFKQDSREIKRISFTFSKQRKIDAFLELMNEGGFRFTETHCVKPRNIRTKQKRIFHVFDIDYAHKDISKFFDLSAISLEKAKEIIEYMVIWDGSINSRTGQYYFSNTDEASVDFYQSVSILSGYKTNKTIQIDGRSAQFNDIHRLFITKERGFVGTQSFKKTIKKHNGKVYCVTVPSGNIIVRRNGKPIVIGNCHNVSNNPESSIRKIIKSLQRINPKLVIIGFSGSPYRMNQGVLENDNLEGEALFTECAYTSNIAEMMKLGYIAHVESMSGSISVDLSDKKFSGSGDFNQQLAGVKFDEIIVPAVQDIQKNLEFYDIETAVIFASTVENAERIKSLWDKPDEIRVLSGKTGKKERDETILWLIGGQGNRRVVNVGILTTGFNMPALDAIVFMRATKSLSLYIQCIGRVIRAHTKDCGNQKVGKIWDYGTNIERLGEIDNIVPPAPKKRRGDIPKKLCTITLDQDFVDEEGIIHRAGYDCNTPNILSAKKCKLCNAHFMTDNDTGDYSMISHAAILRTKKEKAAVLHDIAYVNCEKHMGKNDKIMLKLVFFDANGSPVHNHFLCLDHTGFAREQARRFVMKMFKVPKDFYLIGGVGVSVENMNHLFNDNYDTYFKRVKRIALAPQKGNAKYSEIAGIEYEGDEDK